MNKVIILLIVVASAVALPANIAFPRLTPLNENENSIIPAQKTSSSTTPPNYKPNQFEQEQNRAAKYQFSSNIEDHISDSNNHRDEVRDGLNVRGSYSYSDGYVKRTVHYEADDKGYRVVSEEVEPLNGPNVDLTGSASVDNAAHGTHISYKVQSIPIPGPVAKIVDQY